MGSSQIYKIKRTMKKAGSGNEKKKSAPKKTRQGKSINTKSAPTPSSQKKKVYRGQGK